MKTLAATVLILVLSTQAHAAYAPVEASYTITGASGDYTLDFSFKNNLIHSQNAPGDWMFYKLGVELPGATHLSSPFAYTASAPQDTYTHAWTFQQDGWGNNNVMLFPQTTLGGFQLHSTELQPPSIASFYMTGSASPGNGREGFHSGGKIGVTAGVRSGLTVATLTGLANGTLVQAPQGLTPVPLPPAVVLFAAGLLALIGLSARNWRTA